MRNLKLAERRSSATPPLRLLMTNPPYWLPTLSVKGQHNLVLSGSVSLGRADVAAWTGDCVGARKSDGSAEGDQNFACGPGAYRAEKDYRVYGQDSIGAGQRAAFIVADHRVISDSAHARVRWRGGVREPRRARNSH